MCVVIVGSWRIGASGWRRGSPWGAVTDPGKNLAFSFHRSDEELGLWSFLARRDEGRLS